MELPFFRKYITVLQVCFCFSTAFLSVPAEAQVSNNKAITYTFDDHTFREEHNRIQTSPVGVMLVEDRFGNDKSAVGINGNVHSYLNLGVSPLLRPKEGTISIWVNPSGRVYAGKGSLPNPILLMKNGPGDDFYEAVCLYYTGEDRSFVAVSSRDSVDEVMVRSINPIKCGSWYHLVLVMDDHSFAFYINGNLQGKCRKDFETRFLATDSLMIGHTANKKNIRFFLGAIDDVGIFHRVLSEQEIRDLYSAPNPNSMALILKEVLYWGGIALSVVLLSFLLVARRRRGLKRASERLDLNRQLHEMEIRTLKSQMNPHFIFNALNSIQAFIMNKDNAKAEMYLSKFSKLLRELLESNTNESLSVAEEAAILNSYLEIESLRFGTSFSYEVRVDEQIHCEQTRIPHMMIQPFVENAIWHGLLTKKSDRKLEVLLEYDSRKTIRCTIDDNGVGRGAHPKKESTFKKKSLALSIVRQRLELMNTLLKASCKVEITDKVNADGSGSGTRVVVVLPILSNN